MKYAIPADLLQAIAQYLATKPWGEVEAFMRAIKALQPVTPPPAEDKAD
jgi:hypothetical protein